MEQVWQFHQEMAATAAELVRTLADVPGDTLEDRLVTLDSLLDTLGGGGRPAAATLLQDAAARCAEAWRQQRLLAAAADVAAGQPCARTPDGMTAAEAARAATSHQDRALGTQPSAIRDLRPGMLIRVRQAFRDFDGQQLAAGETLRFLRREYFHHDGGHTLFFEEKVVRLAEIVPANRPVIENRDGAYFELVPPGSAAAEPGDSDNSREDG